MSKGRRHVPQSTSTPIAEPVQNNLGDVIGYGSFNVNGLPNMTPFVGTEPISDTSTLYKNLRWFLVSNLRQLLSQCYCEIGLIQAIVDIPVDDAMRGGIEIKSKQLSHEQIEDLQVRIDRDGDLITAGQAAKWNRLYGGSGILILSDQNPKTPLKLDSLTSDDDVSFRAADMWELFTDRQSTEGYDSSLQTAPIEHYEYYGRELHVSRVLRMSGKEPPSFVRPRLRGWGLSVVEILIRSINQYLKATDLSFEVLDEFKLDVYKIKNLTNSLLSPVASQKIKERVQMANWQKNYQNAVVMDAEDEFTYKQLSFAGLAEAMAGIRMQVASDMRMPLTKLFGISAAGFSSGEEDIEVYNAMVESQVREKLKHDLLKMIEIKCQVMFGFVPDDMTIQFKPLRVLSAEQEENVKTQKFTRLMQAVQAGLISSDQFMHACNKGNLFDIALDEVGDLITEDDASDEGASPGKLNATKEDGRAPDAKRAPDSPTKSREKDHTTESMAPKIPKPGKKPAASKEIKNSIEFDVASYVAWGGDATFDTRRIPFFTDPNGVDKCLWEAAIERSKEAYGDINYGFAIWWYTSHGGKFL